MGMAGQYPYWKRPEPQLRPVPDVTRGFRVRLDLLDTKPPVWRRLDLPGGITLPRLHVVIQEAMGWTDSHLHKFRTGTGPDAGEFLTQFDLDEGDEGIVEDDVRLDQVLAAVGDRLWYDYDFGDGWRHRLRVEAVLDEPPTAPVCIKGKLACPPEDCGGVWGYTELAEWVRSDYDDARLPHVFPSKGDALSWLPEAWHPDEFDLAEINERISWVTADPVAVTEELASLLDLSANRGARQLRDTLAHPASYGTTRLDGEEAARITEPFRALLDVIGEGQPLTASGYLKPTLVKQLAQATGLTEWWIGKVNREDLTWPIWQLRDLARQLGLVAVRSGRITPTRVARGAGADPQAMVEHISKRLPLGRKPAERHAGWTALATVGAESPAEHWKDQISEMMYGLGWRDGRHMFAPPQPHSATLETLEIMAGSMRGPTRIRGVHLGVAALARGAIRAEV
ncbi:hypothetical protein GCM10011359_16460 [Nesterenkonia alkaliphila]|nr:hypothetical protein GCM10011359_16460 [Nesterenkonia alkaliphila]